jgi:hypothetical protein
MAMGMLGPGEKLPRWATPERVKHIQEHVGVDTAIIASDIGICEAYVQVIQRRLGLRLCANYQPRSEA